MKRFYFLLLLVLSLKSFGQATTVTADPLVGLPYLTSTTASGAVLDANALTTGMPMNLRLNIQNVDFFNSIPTGSAKIKIGLGSGLIVDPAFNMATAPLSAYFSWSRSISGGQMQIIGTLIAPLPANFDDEGVFRLMATVVTPNSTIIGQWLISNDNPAFNLIDANPGNNYAALNYKVALGAGPLPVTFKSIKAAKAGCSVNVAWSIGTETNVRKYEIETSKDGVTYVKVGEQNAQNRYDYTGAFTLNDQIAAARIYVRIKVIDINGTFHYSDIATVDGQCQKADPWIVTAYPNPVSQENYINIMLKAGTFNGKYTVVILDQIGKVYQVKEMTLTSATKFTLNFDRVLASGKYIVKIISVDGSKNANVEFQVIR